MTYSQFYSAFARWYQDAHVYPDGPILKIVPEAEHCLFRAFNHVRRHDDIRACLLFAEAWSEVREEQCVQEMLFWQ